MNQEEKIKNELINKFDYLHNSIIIKRERRIFVDVPIEHCTEVLDYLVTKMQFSILSAITGMDDVSSFDVIYHLSCDNCVMLNLKTHLAKEKPVINTITSYFANADIYERELMDLLGIKVIGLSEGNRYPLPEDWPKNDFPLRKDWKGKPVISREKDEDKNE